MHRAMISEGRMYRRWIVSAVIVSLVCSSSMTRAEDSIEAILKHCENLQNTNTTVNSRLEALDEIAALGPKLEGICNSLRAPLRARDETVRIRAIRTVGKLGPTAAMLTASELVHDLQDPSPAVRAEAALVLAQASGFWRRSLVVPALIRAVKDSDPKVRLRAISSLGSFGPAAKPAIPALLSALSDTAPITDDPLPFKSISEAALDTLIQIGPEAREALPDLLRMLQGLDEDLRRAAVKILSTIGPPDEKTARILKDALADKDIRLDAAIVLSRNPRYAGDALPVLVEGLDVSGIKDQSTGGPADMRQYRIVRALGEMGPAAWPAVPRLLEILKEPKREFVHDEVRRELKKIRR